MTEGDCHLIKVMKLSPPDPPKGGEKSEIPPFGGLGGPKSAVNLMTLVT
jgi:hypothetical protein